MTIFAPQVCAIFPKILSCSLWCWLVRGKELELEERRGRKRHMPCFVIAGFMPESDLRYREKVLTWMLLKIVLILLICLFLYLTWHFSNDWEWLENWGNCLKFHPGKKKQSSESIYRSHLRKDKPYYLKSCAFNKKLSHQSYKHIYSGNTKKQVMKM